jgi:hypothetical protein
MISYVTSYVYDVTIDIMVLDKSGARKAETYIEYDIINDMLYDIAV